MRRVIIILIAVAGFAFASSSAHAQDASCTTTITNGNVTVNCPGAVYCSVSVTDGTATANCDSTAVVQTPMPTPAPQQTPAAPSEPAPQPTPEPVPPVATKPKPSVHHRAQRARRFAFVSYNQGDPRWSRHRYAPWGSTLAATGCLPTSLAMVAATLQGDRSITPPKVGDFVGRYYRAGLGARNRTALGKFAGRYSLSVHSVKRNLNRVADTLKQGGLGVILVAPGYFTGAGHYMVIRAVKNGRFRLADPNSRGRHGDSETRWFSARFLKGQGRLVAAWTFSA